MRHVLREMVADYYADADSARGADDGVKDAQFYGGRHVCDGGAAEGYDEGYQGGIAVRQQRFNLAHREPRKRAKKIPVIWRGATFKVTNMKSLI